MRLDKIMEAVSEDPVVNTLSSMVSTVNNLSDLLSTQGDYGKDFLKELKVLAVSLEYNIKKIDSMQVPDDVWAGIGNMANSKTWSDFQASVANGAAARALRSIRDLIQRPVEANDTRLKLARERVAMLLNLIIGIAPSGSPNNNQ